MKYVLNIFPESSAPGQHQQVGESSSVLKLKAQAKDTFEDNAQIVDGDTRKVISVGMWNEKLQDYKWQDAPKSQLVSDEILSNLCSYDERNPIGVYSYTSQEDVNDIKEPRDDCSCDSCFYGKDRLALEIIRLVTTLNPIGQLLSGKPDGADVLSTRFSDWSEELGISTHGEELLIEDILNQLEFDYMLEKAKEVIKEWEVKTGLTLWPYDVYHGNPAGLFSSITVSGVFDLVSVNLMKNGYNVYNGDGVYQFQKAPIICSQFKHVPVSEKSNKSHHII